jgi:uridine kinase
MQIIAIAGASALGKSTFAQALARGLRATVIGTDAYLIPRDERTMSVYETSAIRIKRPHQRHPGATSGQTRTHP